MDLGVFVQDQMLLQMSHNRTLTPRYFCSHLQIFNTFLILLSQHCNNNSRTTRTTLIFNTVEGEERNKHVGRWRVQTRQEWIKNKNNPILFNDPKTISAKVIDDWYQKENRTLTSRGAQMFKYLICKNYSNILNAIRIGIFHKKNKLRHHRVKLPV